MSEELPLNVVKWPTELSSFDAIEILGITLEKTKLQIAARGLAEKAPYRHFLIEFPYFSHFRCEEATFTSKNVLEPWLTFGPTLNIEKSPWIKSSAAKSVFFHGDYEYEGPFIHYAIVAVNYVVEVLSNYPSTIRGSDTP